MDVASSDKGEKAPILDLPTFDISLEFGFLDSSLPLVKLPGQYFSKWEELLTELPHHIKQGTLRDAIHQLPELDFSDSTLKTREEWQRAYLLLCFLGQGYIWMKGEAGIVDVVPKKIAVPWFTVSRHLGMRPVGNYASTVLYNYGVRDPSLPRDNMDNIYALQTFTGTKDESHFYHIHILMELAAAPAIRAIGTIYNKMSVNDNRAIMECLKTIKDSIVKIQEVVSRMYEGCNTKTFFVEIRPFFAGSLGLDVFPNGIVYEGVDPLPMKFHGASAGQSSVLFALDAFLGISQSGEAQKFVQSMIDYMPSGHRAFLLKQKDMPSVPDYCKQSGKREMIALFNDVVEELVNFRNQHFILVVRYIINQKDNSVNPSLDTKGTGGSVAVDFLKSVRDETAARKIKIPE